MSDQDELVDVLTPPLFEPSGEVKSREQAHTDGSWIGTFNLWIFTNNPVPSIIYQQRGPEKKWAPGMLDVAAGGHYTTGEKLTDGLREVEEELGKKYSPEDIKYLGRKIYVGFNTNGGPRNEVIEVYMIEDDSPLDSYKLQKEELYALCGCPVEELIKAHRDETYIFHVDGLDAEGKKIDIEVSKSIFPLNFDSYHYKMAVLADRYFKGEKDLLY
jgi:hypothetical protein